MPESDESAPRPRRKLLCGATSCGGCVKECGVVVYRYLAGLEEVDDREEPVPPAERSTVVTPRS